MSETQAPLGQAIIMSSFQDITNPMNDNVYRFVKNSYYGSGGYMTGDYLVKHDKESNINRRRRNIYYKNYIKGIVDSLVTPVFTDPAMRETNSDLFEVFLDNVDNRGNGIQAFSKNVLKYTRMHGVAFVIMDNFTEVPDSKDEIISNRTLPFLIMKTAEDVGIIETDDFNNLEEISFFEECEEYDGMKRDIYKLWTPFYSVEYYMHDGKMVEIEDRLEHNLGFLPVVSTYLDIDSDILPIPPVYDLCRMNYTIYNMDSEQRNLERLSGFPMLTIQSKDHEANVNIGTDSLIVYGGEYDGSISAPSWIAPSSDILTVLRDNSSELLNKLIESANVLGASAVSNSYSKSATEVQYSFTGQNFALKDTARIAENFEKMISIMFGQYINQNVEYEVKYSDNYRPSIEEFTSKIELLKTMIDANLSPEITKVFKSELVSLIVNMYKIEVDPESLISTII